VEIAWALGKVNVGFQALPESARGFGKVNVDFRA
jgi:hypothetical protein